MDKKDIGEQSAQGIVDKQKLISRREFLKNLTVYAGALALESAIPGKEGNIRAFDIVTTSMATVIDEVGGKEASRLEKEMIDESGGEGNPDFRQYLDILKSGINEYAISHPQVSVFWQKEEKYLSDTEAAKLLTIPINKNEIFPGDDELIGKNPLELFSESVKEKEKLIKLYTIFYARLPIEIQDVINVANTEMVAVPGTELYKHCYPEVGNVFADDDVVTYYESIKTQLETKHDFKNNSEPITMSDFLADMLEKNSGDLKAALADMSGFLKYMIRSFWGNGTKEIKVQIDWLHTHLKDQINENFSLNDIDKPGDLIGDIHENVTSIWGSIYHVPYMISMLSSISPNIIRSAVFYEYATHKHVAAPYKIHVDMETLKDLDGILGYLSVYEK